MVNIPKAKKARLLPGDIGFDVIIVLSLPPSMYVILGCISLRTITHVGSDRFLNVSLLCESSSARRGSFFILSSFNKRAPAILAEQKSFVGETSFKCRSRSRGSSHFTDVAPFINGAMMQQKSPSGEFSATRYIRRSQEDSAHPSEKASAEKRAELSEYVTKLSSTGKVNKASPELCGKEKGSPRERIPVSRGRISASATNESPIKKPFGASFFIIREYPSREAAIINTAVLYVPSPEMVKGIDPFELSLKNTAAAIESARSFS